jgi:hypothetical protein
MVEQLILTSRSNTDIMNIADIFDEHHISYEFSPVPKEVSSNCGFCIYTNFINFNYINSLLKNHRHLVNMYLKAFNDKYIVLQSNI